jgi:hypothetical protein
MYTLSLPMLQWAGQSVAESSPGILAGRGHYTGVGREILARPAIPSGEQPGM